jgi:predicted TIM-barrel fold metal-dependent hydrolase
VIAEPRVTQVRHELISADDHVQEPPDLWTKRMAKRRWGDRIPHLERGLNGSECWLVDGQVLLDGRVARAGAFMADRNELPMRWEEVPRAAYVPAERLLAMDAAGIGRSVLFPLVAGTAGEAFGRLQDPELELDCVQAYNDWLIEEWAATSDRFIPQCLVPVSPIEATVAEIHRAVGKGHRGVVFPPAPWTMRDVPHVGEPDWDPVWATCEELHVPLCLHAGGAPPMPYAPSAPLAEAAQAVRTPLANACVAAIFLFSRVVLRHPQLKVVFAESGLGWASAYLVWADHQFEADGLAREGYVADGVAHPGYELTPSQLFHRQCYVTGWFESVAPFAPYLGSDHLLWATNLPLANSTWPHTGETIERCFRDVSVETRDQVVWGNAAKLYGILDH